MLGHTKKRATTNYVELLFKIPVNNIEQFMSAIAAYDQSHDVEFFSIGKKRHNFMPLHEFIQNQKKNQWQEFLKKSGLEFCINHDRSEELQDWGKRLPHVIDYSLALCNIPTEIKENLEKIIQMFVPYCNISTLELEKIINEFIEFCRARPAKESVSKESVPWEEVYPNFNPSVTLRGARKREGLTQKQLAHLLGISQTHVSEMEHGKRPIGKEMAKRLAKALNANYRVFL